MNISPQMMHAYSMSESKQRTGFVLLAFVQATLIFTIALIMIPLPKIAADFNLDSAQMLFLQVAYGLPFSGLRLFFPALQ